MGRIRDWLKPSHAPSLGQLARGRDNNFNLIRILAALAVLISHAWPLSLGPDAVEPLKALTGHSLGMLGVYVFFATSGLLIMASFDRAPDWRRFLTARALRLYPGLIVSLLLAGLVLGPAVTSLPRDDYLRDPGVLAFILRNLALVRPHYSLPGVFDTNPYHAVAGSIWTLGYEVACYLAVLAIGLVGAFRQPNRMIGAFAAYGLFHLTVALFADHLPVKIVVFQQLSLPFAAGCLVYLLRDRIRLSGRWLGLVTLAAILLARTALGEPALVLAIAYGTVWLAYVPKGAIRAYNRLGDYSYGTYLYAFPVQGLVVWLWGPMGPGLNILLTLPLVLLLAALSWHLVERPALSLRHRDGQPRQPAPGALHDQTLPQT